jgi:hypothetical protein
MSAIKKNLLFDTAFGGKPALLSLHFNNPTDDALLELDASSIEGYERKEVVFNVPSASNTGNITNANEIEFFFTRFPIELLNQKIQFFGLFASGVGGDGFFWYGSLPETFALTTDKVYLINVEALKLNLS